MKRSLSARIAAHKEPEGGVVIEKDRDDMIYLTDDEIDNLIRFARPHLLERKAA